MHDKTLQQDMEAVGYNEADKFSTEHRKGEDIWGTNQS